MPLNTAGSFEALFLLLSVLGGDDGHDLVLDLGHLAVDGANDLVHGLLVVLVGFGLGVLVGLVTGFVVNVGLGLTVVGSYDLLR